LYFSPLVVMMTLVTASKGTFHLSFSNLIACY